VGPGDYHSPAPRFLWPLYFSGHYISLVPTFLRPLHFTGHWKRDNALVYISLCNSSASHRGESRHMIKHFSERLCVRRMNFDVVLGFCQVFRAAPDNPNPSYKSIL
jgi:hypothetical protein